MKRNTFILSIIILSFFYLSNLFATTITKDFEKTIDFKPEGDVHVKSVNGSIELTSWNQNTVEIRAEIKVKAGSRREAERLMERVDIHIDHSSHGIRVEADYPRRSDGSGLLDWIFGDHASVTINYWIKVPKKTNINLKSTNGRIIAENVEGTAELASTNGSIEADALKGSVDAHTTNGSIRTELIQFSDSDRIYLKTTNGSIKLTLPSETNADVQASTVNGSISTDFPLTVKGKFIKRSLKGEINGGGGKITLSTVNGSIRLFEQ